MLAGFPDFVIALTRAGRVAFFSVAFIGSEIVAMDWLSSNYFNAVDEHAASMIGTFVVLTLSAIVAVDAIVRNSVAGLKSSLQEK